IADAVGRAWRRASVNAEMKADVRGKFGSLGDALMDTRLAPVEICEATVPAAYAIDPRALPLAEIVRFTTDISRRLAALDSRLSYHYVGTLTQLSRELYVSSEGACIDQTFALTQGGCWLVADGAASQDLYDAMGHQRGWECL